MAFVQVLSLYGAILSDTDESVTSVRLEAARIGLQRLPHLREFLRDLSIDFLGIEDGDVCKLDETSKEHVEIIQSYLRV